MTDIVAEVEEHSNLLRLHDKRIADVEADMYGNDRTNRTGLIMQSQNISLQVNRLVIVVWGLVLAIAILAVTVAVAVLV